MTLLGSWAGPVCIPPDGEVARREPITSRHFLCDACRIPLRVEYCPAHQKRLVVPPVFARGAGWTRRRPQRCPSLGCTYEKPRDEAPLQIG